MKLLIATATKPKNPQGWKTMCDIIRKSINDSPDDIALVSGILLTSGRGCNNMAMELHGDAKAIERFATSLTIALMPSKWCEGHGDIPNVDTNEVGYADL